MCLKGTKVAQQDDLKEASGKHDPTAQFGSMLVPRKLVSFDSENVGVDLGSTIHVSFYTLLDLPRD